MRDRAFAATLIALALLPAVSGWVAAAGQGGGEEPGPFIAVEPGASIQSSIDSAPEGSVLRLGPGTYVENLVINKPITLAGSSGGAFEIVGASSGSVIRVVGEEIAIRLENLTVRGARGYHAHGVTVEGSCAVDLVQVTLTDNAWCGIRAVDRADVRLTDCSLSENGTSGSLSEDFAHVRFERCTIAGNTSHGVHALHLSDITIVNSSITENWTGIWAWDATRVYVYESSIFANIDYGAIASNAALLVLESSSVVRNGYHGLLFEESSRGILRASRISENGADGLHMQQDGFLEINDCVFEANGGAGLRTSIGPCTGGFDPELNFNGRITGAGNRVPGPGEENGNGEIALCPMPPGTWPDGFLGEP